MIKLFRNIRKNLLNEGKTTKYFKYAIGEIVLVVIGILIALQINNWNEQRKERSVEINYLNNLKTDLRNEIDNNKDFTTFRIEKAKNCSFLLNITFPKTIKDAKSYTEIYEQVFYWKYFIPNNNTFKELLSSGNLSLIKNDSIKNALLELDKQYAEISNIEHHLRREFEQYLYDISIKNIAGLSFWDTSKPVYELPTLLKIEDIPESQHKKLIADVQWLYNNQIFNNGLKLAMMNNSGLVNIHKNTGQYITQLLKLIDEEIKR
jgi:hypothetical protein